jgi:type I restriction enzyme M protein
LDKVRRQADEYFALGTDKHHRHWHDFAQHNLFGIEINEQIARTAKMNMIIHDDGHTNVVAADGLLPPDDIRQKTRNEGFKAGRFDFIITNPPFGSTVKLTEKAYLHQYRLATRQVDWLNPKSKASERPGQDTEILFIEQCSHYLADNGYLAIVIPDGILTNSSLQYVREEIDDLYRIVAVVSLPQTAFTATGAGVKSSVLILKKRTADQTQKMRDIKQGLKDKILDKEKLEKKLEAIERAKKNALKDLIERPEFASLDARKESDVFALAAAEIANHFADEVDDLRDQLTERYEALRRKALPNYSIFMGITEDIGYDATGRPTKVNELEQIGDELSRFIMAIEAGKA